MWEKTQKSWDWVRWPEEGSTGHCSVWRWNMWLSQVIWAASRSREGHEHQVSCSMSKKVCGPVYTLFNPVRTISYFWLPNSKVRKLYSVVVTYYNSNNKTFKNTGVLKLWYGRIMLLILGMGEALVGQINGMFNRWT